MCDGDESCGVDNLAVEAQKWIVGLTPEIRNVTKEVASNFDSVLQDKKSVRATKTLLNDTTAFLQNTLGFKDTNLDFASDLLDSKNSEVLLDNVAQDLSSFDTLLQNVEKSYRKDDSTEIVAEAVSVFRKGLWNWGVFRKPQRDDGN